MLILPPTARSTALRSITVRQSLRIKQQPCPSANHVSRRVASARTARCPDHMPIRAALSDRSVRFQSHRRLFLKVNRQHSPGRHKTRQAVRGTTSIQVVPHQATCRSLPHNPPPTPPPAPEPAAPHNALAVVPAALEHCCPSPARNPGVVSAPAIKRSGKRTLIARRPILRPVSFRSFARLANQYVCRQHQPRHSRLRRILCARKIQRRSPGAPLTRTPAP